MFAKGQGLVRKSRGGRDTRKQCEYRGMAGTDGMGQPAETWRGSANRKNGKNRRDGPQGSRGPADRKDRKNQDNRRDGPHHILHSYSYHSIIPASTSPEGGRPKHIAIYDVLPHRPGLSN